MLRCIVLWSKSLWSRYQRWRRGIWKTCLFALDVRSSYLLLWSNVSSRNARMNARMHKWMHEWRHKWVREWMHACTNECTNECTHAQINARMKARMSTRMNARMNQWMHAWMHEWKHDWMHEWMLALENHFESSWNCKSNVLPDHTAFHFVIANSLLHIHNFCMII